MKFDPTSFYTSGIMVEKTSLVSFSTKVLWVLDIYLFCIVVKWIVEREYYVVRTVVAITNRRLL